MQRDTARCNATRRDGSRCKSPVVLPSGVCPMHDPERQRQVAGMRADGGKARGRARRFDRLMPATLRPTLALVLTAIDEVYEGTLPPAPAQAMSALAGAVVRLYEVAELEQRLDALEHQAEGRTA